jgi:formate dehydrogenase iron-sulfur subunit
VLTAVDRFSARHDDGRVPASGPYRSVLPGVGQQYAFEVDLDACTGCKACVTACHSMNGLDPDESWRTVGLLVGTADAYQQTVTAACHHCVDPACMSGCPVDAYEKDPVTGIVHHLDDQCIGCRYCTLTCPYEVPKFNKRLGIVRKCDLCSPRLAMGESPACAQGCPNEAIRVTIVDTAAPSTWSLPATPSPTLTQPTTIYRTERVVPDAVPADHFEVRAAAAHDPLALVLVLTQLAVGTAIGAPSHAVITLLVAVIAMVASLGHLGRPHLAWKAVLGLRHSWVSREIVSLSVFTALAGATTVLPVPQAATVGAGLTAVACSVGIYATTRRRWWSVPRLTVRFGLGVAGFALAAADLGVACALVIIAIAAAASETLVHRRRPHTELGRSAVLLLGDLRPRLQARFALLAFAAALALVLPLAAAAALLVSEYLDRTLLFTASAAPRMPGGRR